SVLPGRHRCRDGRGHGPQCPGTFGGLPDGDTQRLSLHCHRAGGGWCASGDYASTVRGARALCRCNGSALLAQVRVGHPEKRTMPSDTALSDMALEVVALLQKAGILTPAAAEAALQKVVSHYCQVTGMEVPVAASTPAVWESPAEGDAQGIDEYRI